MQNLYPIIRRVRRPLLPPETEPVVSGARMETNAADEKVVVAPPASRARADVRQLNSKGKAD